MKKIILGSLSVLSLGLFSFMVPKTSTGVWLYNDGNYSIDDYAVQNFSSSDQQSVASLVATIYNTDVTVAQTLSMIQYTNGAAMFQKEMAALILSNKYFKTTNPSINPNGPEYALYQIINSYAQPANQ